MVLPLPEHGRALPLGHGAAAAAGGPGICTRQAGPGADEHRVHSFDVRAAESTGVAQAIAALPTTPGQGVSAAVPTDQRCSPFSALARQAVPRPQH